MNISLLAPNSNNRGPGKVFQNLFLGLKNISQDITITHNEISNHITHYGCLQHIGNSINSLDKERTLFGPNLFVLPTDDPNLSRGLKHIVVPSEWVKDLYRKFSILDHANIHVWSVGIDTKEWKPLANGSFKKDLDCFVYFKNRDLISKENVMKQLDSMNLKYEFIEYGSYKEEDLKKLCDRAKFAILLTGTESQGIAYMQILSMNIPCYVFNQTTWTSENKDICCTATSVPYFNKQCGYITNDLDASKIPTFMNELSNYTPRNFIENNHSILSSAKKYKEIITTCQNELWK